jgi:ATP/maltotriose-dependent transcriptional regulator MalT
MSPLIALSQLWRTLENKAKAVELLTLVAHEPQNSPTDRDKAQLMLRQLQSEMPPAAFSDAEVSGRNRVIRSSTLTIPPSGSPSISELLSVRESEILRLIGDGLSNGEIADQLVLAKSTVKWYINQIFSKLDVTSRTQAVARARTLGLFT